MAQVDAQHRPHVRPTMWKFDLTLLLPAFSSAEDVHLTTWPERFVTTGYLRYPLPSKMFSMGMENFNFS